VLVQGLRGTVSCFRDTGHDLPTATAQADLEAVKKRVSEDTPYWAEQFGKIVDKSSQLVPLVYKPGQLEFDRQLELQRAAGKPMRMVVLKARKVGISTATQAKMIQRCTLRENQYAVVVAQDRETGDVLYQIGERLYTNLPTDDYLKPKVGQHRRSRFLHFTGEASWMDGAAYPDSRYKVDTAGEFQSGRGGTPTAIHASEVAFWDQILVKLTALKNAMPREPETMFVIESTANGFNAFKDIWDDAAEGRSNYGAFFWPWHKEAEYRMPFINPRDRERFIIGDPDNPYAEEEPDLVKNLDLDLEQLNWRRQTIADECNGDVRTFHQEYPATPEQAFISTGQKVFDPYRMAQIMVRVDATDPRQPSVEHPGPRIGDLKMEESRRDPSRTGGTIEVPTSAVWVPRERGLVSPTAPWRLWLSDEKLQGLGPVQRAPDLDRQPPRPTGEYIVFCDPSGGQMETTDEPDYHAIEVIDHRTGDQVAEYRSRIDPDLLTREVLLAALFFNMAYIGVERTGGWGLPILRTLWMDFHYPHVYRSKKVGNANERTESRLGWDTNMRTKPLLIAGFTELLRIGEDGIKSRVLANEARTYTRTEKGTTEAEPGRYDDCLMAYMGAQQLARELPFKGDLGLSAATQQGFSAPRLGAYDPRVR
jgi:hypothetical protein